LRRERPASRQGRARRQERRRTGTDSCSVQGLETLPSTAPRCHRDCCVAALLAMTTLCCHCERSEAISILLSLLQPGDAHRRTVALRAIERVAVFAVHRGVMGAGEQQPVAVVPLVLGVILE